MELCKREYKKNSSVQSLNIFQEHFQLVLQVLIYCNDIK